MIRSIRLAQQVSFSAIALAFPHKNDHTCLYEATYKEGEEEMIT